MIVETKSSEAFSVRFEDVTKVYELYGSPAEMVLHNLGLPKFLLQKRNQIPRFTALDRVSFTIGKGERVGFVGRNGAGKTTALRLITRNYPATSGTVTVNGDLQALMQLGLGFHPEFSGYENIKAALNYNGLVGPAFDRAIEDVIEFCELGDFLHQPLKTYSLGMQTRVQFAAATAIQPDILLVDEVLGAGDSYFSAKSSIRMERLARSGCTLIMVSHSWQLIQQYCERVIWLEKGRIRMDGAAYEVLAAYEADIAKATSKFLPKKEMAESTSPTARKILDAGSEQSDHQSSAAPAQTTIVEPSASASLQSGSDSADGKEAGEDEAKLEIKTDAESDSADQNVPDLSRVAWIAEQLRKREGIESADETTVVLSNGRTCHRVAGIEGIRLIDFNVFVDGSPKNTARTGCSMAVALTLQAQHTDTFACSYWVHFFGLDGVRLGRVRSPIDHFSLEKSKTRVVQLSLAPLLLGAREYLLSFSVFDNRNSASSADTLTQRYDMLPRCFLLKISGSNDSDPPVVHHPANWLFGTSQVSMSGEITDRI